MLRIEQENSPYGARLITDQPLKKGQLIYSISTAKGVATPTYQTIQVGPNEHLADLGPLAYLNHSCRPSTYVDTTARTLTAAQDLAAGEELTYFYPTTEWEMIQPFVCQCGAPECLRLIAGARYVSIDVLSRYPINEHVQRMIGDVLSRATASDRAARPRSLRAPSSS